MKKINFSTDVLPHASAVAVFLLVTILFFNPIFFGNKTISQGDITQFLWGSKELRDYRAATGEEGLWSNAMFSGMPAYMVNLEWSDGVVKIMKQVLSFFLPHPINNIFLAFVCYYILLLVFRVRPYLAIAAALAFGLTSYMIIGLSAGHNARIGSIAFMPLVIAGIHLAFSERRLLGFGVTAAGLALHLRENHLQITYYLILVVFAYGVVQLVHAIREKKIVGFVKTLGLLAGAALIAAGTFFGQMWAVSELSRYSTRGKTELITTSQNTIGSGLPKTYAFEYSSGVMETLTLLVPNLYGGSSSNYLVSNEKSETYKTLVQLGDQETANQLARYTSAYWGAQPLAAPYYGGAVVIFLFVLGLLTAEKKCIWWLVPVSLFAILLSWGSNFEVFNYFVFDYLPGYNKFRSVTFALIIVFFSMPLLGALGLESLVRDGLNAQTKRKLLMALASTGGLCLLLLLASGMFSFMTAQESQLPAWFLNALRDDRKELMRADLLRSLFFIVAIFAVLYFNVSKKVSSFVFYSVLIALIAFDFGLVDGRYFTSDNYQRKRDNTRFEPTSVNTEIAKDKSTYRVLNLANFYEANTAAFHRSVGGYHGVRLKRYQELVDSCVFTEQQRLFSDVQQGNLDFSKFGVLNMLNTKYLVYGQDIIPNPQANGPAWFAQELVAAANANEELEKTKTADTKRIAVVDVSKFHVSNSNFIVSDTDYIQLTGQKPYWLKYEAQSASGGLAVFSEIYYPKGWVATVDGVEAPILRANYVLRALEIPKGKHVIEFTFQPKPYLVGNKVTLAASWLLLLVVFGTLVWSLRERT